jgi:hypothetical protein
MSTRKTKNSLDSVDCEKREARGVEFNKKNRVTVAQFASKEAIANTPRSPQFSQYYTTKTKLCQ